MQNIVMVMAPIATRGRKELEITSASRVISVEPNTNRRMIGDNIIIFNSGARVRQRKLERATIVGRSDSHGKFDSSKFEVGELDLALADLAATFLRLDLPD